MSELKVASCFEFEKVLRGKSNKLFYHKSEVDAAIAELKAKLEDVQATAYAESVDAGMENRRLKRALWLARAWGANQRTKYLDLFLTGRAHAIRKYKWIKITSKCRAKAEKYK